MNPIPEFFVCSMPPDLENTADDTRLWAKRLYCYCDMIMSICNIIKSTKSAVYRSIPRYCGNIEVQNYFTIRLSQKIISWYYYNTIVIPKYRPSLAIRLSWLLVMFTYQNFLCTLTSFLLNFFSSDIYLDIILWLVIS